MQTKYPVPTLQLLLTIPVCTVPGALLWLALTGGLGRLPTGFVAGAVVVLVGSALAMGTEVYLGRAIWYPPSACSILTTGEENRHLLVELQLDRRIGVEVRLRYELLAGKIPPMEVVLEDHDHNLLMRSGELNKPSRRPCVYVTCLPGRPVVSARVYLITRSCRTGKALVRAQTYHVLGFAYNRLIVHGGIENWSGPKVSRRT